MPSLTHPPTGPEWRNDVLDEDTGNVESPADTGGRHAAWVEHELRPGALLGATRAGLRLDVGRLANLAADWVDYNLEPSIPGLFWRIPLMPRLYNLLVPAGEWPGMRMAQGMRLSRPIRRLWQCAGCMQLAGGRQCTPTLTNISWASPLRRACRGPAAGAAQHPRLARGGGA